MLPLSKRKTFNLRKEIKKAFYEGAQGYMKPLTRAWMNCYKCKSQEGKTPNTAWNECLSEYQEAGSSNWAIKYSSTEKK